MNERIKTEEINDDFFLGSYKKHTIEVVRMFDGKEQDKFYITVKSEDGEYLYDGYWTDHRDSGVHAAVDEALKGSQLV